MTTHNEPSSEALDLIFASGVSRETIALFEDYVRLLERWQPVKNLIGPMTLSSIWTRHIADSAQLSRHIPNNMRIVDLGSGAGLPGLVLAMISTSENRGWQITLVEANGRKASFLREVARKLDLPIRIENDRIESVGAKNIGADFITARALASLPTLVNLTEPWLRCGAIGLFHKGQDVDDEIRALPKYGNYRYEKIPSQLPDGGCILKLSLTDE